ncbi:thioredoxin-disulfide reductase [Ruminococcus difficilis]|uniref:Thioredoxin reductase n=1 Tax=Ruminococcus difficilis TaxID=2763069 RepID=A0A934WU38_9FIRM|nr:thioredoxin-disulfide reductase [Ruminococcus difficilis]MBK6089952.1 thioredoxin-disulfide reductase [Ruminococcus difficilis]
MYDLIIIGGGVAGMTAAIYAARSGLSTLIIEKAGFGGQAALTAKIENYPSYKEIDGFQLAADIKAQVDALGVESLSAQVQSLTKENDVFTVTTDSDSYQSKAVIIANGVRRRELGIPGEDEFRGRGISWCAVCDGGFFRKKKTAVIGAGNSALGDAIYLSNLCEEVYLIFRRDYPTATKSYMDKLENIDNIRLMPRHIPVEIKGDRLVTTLKIKNVDSGEETDLAVNGVFEAIGLIPDNDVYADLAELDDNGYILTDSEMRTKTPGLFAAGDTRQKSLRQIVTACSDGAQAATAAHDYLSDTRSRSNIDTIPQSPNGDSSLSQREPK